MVHILVHGQVRGSCDVCAIFCGHDVIFVPAAVIVVVVEHAVDVVLVVFTCTCRGGGDSCDAKKVCGGDSGGCHDYGGYGVLALLIMVVMLFRQF